MADRLAGKRIIITGASTGIGKATAILFVAEGAKVVIADVNEPAGKATVAALNGLRSGAALFIRADVTDEESVRRYTTQGTEWLGGLDGAMLHAGVQHSGSIESFDVGKWQSLFQVNALGVFLGAKYAIPAMKEAGGGSIVSTASLAGKRGGPGLTAYSASKGAVVAFTFAAAMELAPFNIRVNCVCPGWVDTPFNQPAIDFMGGTGRQSEVIQNTVPLRRQGTPEELAPIYAYLMSDESRYMTAQSISVDGGVASS